MNCSVDYRTDFYSLGVTLYEMLTGRLPLKSNDPLELIHFHIAKNPIAPSKLNEDIPKAISDIVMKLLSKIPEERYQNSYGLKYDLEKCLKQLVEKGKIEDISIGENDISDKFYLPQKLYGREKEINVLLKTFDEISESKTKIMFVSGYSGIGKTTLINEIHKLVVKKKGYFVAGKFEQFEKDIPYNAIINAFQNLVRNILTENEDRIKIWRNKLLEAVGINGQIIVDVIPEVELIIGKQSSVAQLEPKETQNRFNMIFQKFIEVFSKEEHPLVLFLDDLQWIDIASLNLIDNIITDSTIKFFLIIGAYRDNEVSISHPLILTIDGFKKIGIDISNIKLLPLEVLDVTNLL